MSPNANRHWTVLIVEDEELVRMAAVDELRDRGLKALGAAHAMAALTLLESDASIDLMIADIGLPGLDGRRLAEMARRLRPALKVLFLTGYPIEPGDIEPGTRFVEKPIELKVLAMVAEAMLEERSGDVIHA